MNCKSCNTRIEGSDTAACPNCGRRLSRALRESGPVSDKQQATRSLGEPAIELEQVIRSRSEGRPLKTRPSELKETLAACPELLEPGLRLAMEPAKSVSYQTKVGEIDLLLVDEKDCLIVLMIPESTCMTEALGEILPRMGWVVRHIADGYSSVRGIVLLGRVPGEIDYAAAAVADSVSFRTYRMALRFDSLET